MRKKNETTSQTVTAGVFWKFSERILAQAVSLIVSIILARFILPDQYGVISIVLIFISFADVLTVSGYSAALIQKKDATKVDFDTIFYCSLITSLIVYLILFISAPLIASFYSMPILIPVVRIFSLRVIISSYNSVQHAYVSRHMLFRKFFFSTLIGTIVSGFVGVILAIKGAGVWALVAQYLTNTVIDSIVLTFTISWRPGLNFSSKSAKGLIKYGWKVLVADFSGTFFDQLRSLLIGKVYTSADLAMYDKGKQLPSLVIDNANNSIMSVLFPAISNAGGELKTVNRLSSKLIKTISCITIPLAMFLCAIAEPLVLFLLTDKWSDSVIYMQILCMASAISLTSNISLQTIKAIGRSDILLKLEFIKKPVYIALLIIGMKISVFGVAITSLIYALYGTVTNSKAMAKITGYTLTAQIRDMLNGYIIGLTCAIPVFCINLFKLPAIAAIIIQLIVFVVIYAVMIRGLKIVEISDTTTKIIKKIRSKNDKAI